NAVERLRLAPIQEIVLTDTVQQPPDKRLPNMTVLSVSLLLGEAISRIHTGESVGGRFGAPVYGSTRPPTRAGGTPLKRRALTTARVLSNSLVGAYGTVCWTIGL